MLWRKLEISENSNGPAHYENYLSGVEGTFAVTAVGISRKGVVRLPTVFTELDGPLRAAAYLPEYSLLDEEVLLKLVVENRRNSTHHVTMEVSSASGKFEFVDKIKVILAVECQWKGSFD